MYKKITHNLVEVKLALSKGEGTRMILEAEAAKRKVLEDRIAELEGELAELQQRSAFPAVVLKRCGLKKRGESGCGGQGRARLRALKYLRESWCRGLGLPER